MFDAKKQEETSLASATVASTGVEGDQTPCAAERSVVKDGHEYRFWDGERRGLIRQRDGHGHPEVWKNGRWVYGSAYVMDAITGMGEDPYSCGEWAFDISVQQAEAIAAKLGIEPYAPNPDDALDAT